MFVCENCLHVDDEWGRKKFENNMGISQGPCECCDEVSLCVDAASAHPSSTHAPYPFISDFSPPKTVLEKAIETLAKAKGVTAKEFKQSLIEKAREITVDEEE